METNESTIPKTYEVTWSMIYEANSPVEAVAQALGDLATVINQPNEGPNFFLVTGAGMEDPIVVSADEASIDGTDFGIY